MKGAQTTRLRVAGVFFAAGCAALVWAMIVFLSGGLVFHALGRTISARATLPPLIAGALLLAASRALVRAPEFGRFLRVAIGDQARRPARIAAAAAGCVLVVGIAWNTRAVGGSDSSCYVLQAEAFAHGHVVLHAPTGTSLPGAVPAMFAPVGWIPKSNDGFDAVPICGPGLALMMAPLLAFGRGAVFLVVPVSAAATVWMTFLFGRRASDELTGALAACLMACSPVFLYQAVQPMSDVPATLFWLTALTATARGDRWGQVAGGLCASFAVLTRPNLALAIVPLLWLLRDRGAWVRWILAAVPGACALAALNAVRYGSPLATGYGPTSDLFSMSHVTANLARYSRWFAETQSPFAALAVVAPFVLRRDPVRARLAIAALASAALVFVTYLAYTVFDAWWYLRFLLPILPVVLVYAAAVLVSFVPVRARVVVAAVVACVFAAWSVRVATAGHAFDLQAMESRFPRVGSFARAMPGQTVFIAGQQTGGIRYHGDHLTLTWDAIPSGSLDAVIADLSRRGSRPLIVLDDEEEPGFRKRFEGQRYGGLDWAPSAEITALTRVHVYDPAAKGHF
jgi:hypothetical protein